MTHPNPSEQPPAAANPAADVHPWVPELDEDARCHAAQTLLYLREEADELGVSGAWTTPIAELATALDAAANQRPYVEPFTRAELELIAGALEGAANLLADVASTRSVQWYREVRRHAERLRDA